MYPYIPYTFSNGVGNVIDATAHNQNFTALTNGYSDGSKDLNVASVSCTTITADTTQTQNASIACNQLAIGTASPDSTVHVVGNIGATGYIWTEKKTTGTLDWTGYREDYTSTTEHEYLRIGNRAYCYLYAQFQGNQNLVSVNLPYPASSDMTAQTVPANVYTTWPAPTGNYAPGMGIIDGTKVDIYRNWSQADGTWQDRPDLVFTPTFSKTLITDGSSLNPAVPSSIIIAFRAYGTTTDITCAGACIAIPDNTAGTFYLTEDRAYWDSSIGRQPWGQDIIRAQYWYGFNAYQPPEHVYLTTQSCTMSMLSYLNKITFSYQV